MLLNTTYNGTLELGKLTFGIDEDTGEATEEWIKTVDKRLGGGPGGLNSQTTTTTTTTTTVAGVEYGTQYIVDSRQQIVVQT